MNDLIINDFNYLSLLDNNKIKFYTLQLANMKRIEENDVVYIFDEVGAGKTISAGLSIIQLLFQHQNKDDFKNVLIITAPPVIEQFKNKLKNLLELTVGEGGKYNNKRYNIKIINYDYRNICKLEKKYDFIIVDEAHEFLNSDTKRYEELIKLEAKKIMFLTATPIKYSRKDLEIYSCIASKIIHKNFQQLKKTLLDACNNNGLSGGFDHKSPVTRYFKETVRNIEKTEDGNEFRDKEPRRLVPELWEYEYNDDVNTFLANKIDEHFNGINRFVVFVRYIRDTKNIEKALKVKGFENYLENCEGYKTYSLITGETENRKLLLKEFSTDKKEKKLPDVLILTYKISEQGIDLPAYNYIINYHISSSPSQLEQRFGRIDRLNSVYDELNTCFILKNTLKKNILCSDTNTKNFYIAVNTYINEFLPLLPSKNCLITSKILEKVSENNESIKLYYKNLLNNCKNSDIVQKAHNILLNSQNYESDNEFYNLESFCKLHNILLNSENYQLNNEIYNLASFCKHEDFDIIHDIEEFEENICKQIEKYNEQSSKSIERINWWQSNIDKVSNNIFYINTDETKIDWSKKYDIETIDPKVVAKEISNSKCYQSLSESLKKPLEIMKSWNKYKNSKKLEEYFENLFHKNRFDLLFPEEGDYELNEIFNDYEFKKHINSLITTVPFFKMCNKYKKIVQELIYNDDRTLKIKYDFDPLEESIKLLKEKSHNLGISNNFFDNYSEEGSSFFFQCNEDENNKVVASNWLKLIYMYSKPEEFTFASTKKDFKTNECKFNKEYESIIEKNGAKYYIVTELYNKIVKFITTKKSTLPMEEYNNMMEQYAIFWPYNSLFNHFYFNNSHIKREKVSIGGLEDICINEKLINDNLTKQILQEMKKIKGGYCHLLNYNNLLDVPTLESNYASDINANGFYIYKNEKTVKKITINDMVKKSKHDTELFTKNHSLVSDDFSINLQQKPDIYYEDDGTVVEKIINLRKGGVSGNIITINFISSNKFSKFQMEYSKNIWRTSAIKVCLEKFQNDFYNFHKELKNPLYSHRMVYSPHVPIFMNSNYELLPQPVKSSFISMFTVYTKSSKFSREPKEQIKIRITEEMNTRIKYVVDLALRKNPEVIIINSYGAKIKINEYELDLVDKLKNAFKTKIGSK